MKKFLDDTMRDLNRDWRREEKAVNSTIKELFAAVEAAKKIYGDNVGRKYSRDRFESAFNRAVFEVQVFFLTKPDMRTAANSSRSQVNAAFKKLCANARFMGAIESTTKSLENTRTRFDLYRLMLQRMLGVKIPAPPIGSDED